MATEKLPNKKELLWLKYIQACKRHNIERSIVLNWPYFRKTLELHNAGKISEDTLKFVMDDAYDIFMECYKQYMFLSFSQLYQWTYE